MGRLIDVDILLAKVVEANPMGGMIGGKFIEDLIKMEPTAYDVDKVVEGIETLISHKGFGGTVQTMYGDILLSNAIDIVKGGGKDE